MIKLLITGDWHIDDKAPVCRKDSETYLETIDKKLSFIIDTAIKNKVDAVIQPGDVFDKSRPDQAQLLEIMLFKKLQKLQEAKIPFIAIPGNHDLPYHNLNNLGRSSLGVLGNIGACQVLLNDKLILSNKIDIYGFPYGTDIIPAPIDTKIKIAIIHEYIFERTVPSFMSGQTARDLVELNAGWDIIIAGHLHTSYMKKINNTLVINAGCILRLMSNEADFQPRINLVTIDKELTIDQKITTEWINIPIEKDIISREHLDNEKLRDERIASFVEQMESNNIVGLDFIANLENYIAINKTETELKNKIWELVQ